MMQKTEIDRGVSDTAAPLSASAIIVAQNRISCKIAIE